MLKKSAPIYFAFLLSAFLLSSISPAPLRAQFVRDDATPQASAETAKTPAQTPAPSPAQTITAPGGQRLSQEIQLTGDQYWIDTGIDVKPAERVVVTGGGTLRYADAASDSGPEGQKRGWRDLLRILPAKDGGRGALIGRIGDADTGQPFLIGAKRDSVSPAGGRLFLGINQPGGDSADGTLTARVEVYAAAQGAAALAVARDVAILPGVDAKLFATIPRRISDKAGNPGDMVNFLILGSEDDMRKTFETAGWVKVDSTKTDAFLHGLLESLSKESYVAMPMSELYLFGRHQDYGFAHAEPITVVKTRHHLRLWKAAFQVNGQTLWVGAATHDIGFERDKRNNGVTHKIDPDIDLERDYVEKSLSATGLVAEKTHFKPTDALAEAKTATGGTFHSNGQVLVLNLAKQPAAK
jgi:hypothetical protein